MFSDSFSKRKVLSWFSSVVEDSKMKLSTVCKSILSVGLIGCAGTAFAGSVPNKIFEITPSKIPITVSNNTPEELEFRNVIYENVGDVHLLPPFQRNLLVKRTLNVTDPAIDANVYIPVYINGKAVCTADISYDHADQSVGGKVDKTPTIVAGGPASPYHCSVTPNEYRPNGMVTLNVWKGDK